MQAEILDAGGDKGETMTISWSLAQEPLQNVFLICSFLSYVLLITTGQMATCGSHLRMILASLGQYSRLAEMHASNPVKCKLNDSLATTNKQLVAYSEIPVKPASIGKNLRSIEDHYFG